MSTPARLALVVLAAAAAAAVPPARAAALAAPAAPTGALAPPVSTGEARLVGSFALEGTVTVADDVPGERKSRHFQRRWRFSATCPRGECPTENLIRPRAGGSDTLLLRRQAPGYYIGSGGFYAPIRCAGRTYRAGALVPFTIGVRITAATLVFGVDIATRVRAAYTNTRRTNLTPCVAALGHDAATYHGHIVADRSAAA